MTDFGRKPGQSPSDFMAELKTLDNADRDYFRKGLEAEGYQIQ